MSVTSSSLPGRALALAAALALVASLLLGGLLAAPALSAGHHYPAAEKKAFMKTCVPAAVKSANGNLTRSQARRYCASALTCIERKLSLSEFAAAINNLKSAHGKIVVRCEKQAIAEVTG
jgi:hypothetical protein